MSSDTFFLYKATRHMHLTNLVLWEVGGQRANSYNLPSPSVGSSRLYSIEIDVGVRANITTPDFRGHFPPKMGPTY